MPNKTIYVSDDDLPLFARAQELAGGNLSLAIARALRQFVETEEAAKAGYHEITVRVGSGGNTQRKRFTGRQLAQWRHQSQGGRVEVFTVYQTAKGRFAVHTRSGPFWIGFADAQNWLENLLSGQGFEQLFGAARQQAQRMRGARPPWMDWKAAWSRGEFPFGEWMGHVGDPGEATLEVYENLDQLAEHIPAELLQLVKQALDNPGIEDLDI